MSGNRWQVFRSMSGWWGHPLNSCGLMDERAKHFPTHAEAMDYADRQARTVTLELPRVRNQREIVTNGYRSFISRQRGGRIWLEHDQAVFCILPEEAESFAQTILALHYHRKENQK